MIIYLYKKPAQNKVKSEPYIIDAVKRYSEEKGILLLETPKLERGEKGKPYLSGTLRDKIFVSASHSGEFVACGVADSEIGLDLEKNRESLHFLKIAKRFFLPDEYEYVGEKGIEAFFEIWVRKEAYMKYTGKGFSQGFKTIKTISDLIFQEKVNNIRMFSAKIKKEYFIAWCGEDQESAPMFVEVDDQSI